MRRPRSPGRIVVLNGAPRAGKSSIAEAVQRSVAGTWVNLGVDVARVMTPPALQPGIGLRPGEPDHPAAAWAPRLYAALYDSIAAHSRAGLDVVVDVGHHDAGVLADCARRMAGLPALLVGVHCPIEVIMTRRLASGMVPEGELRDGIPEPVRRWQKSVHVPGVYDLELDTSLLSPAECARQVDVRLAAIETASAFRLLAG
jgi:chloramphenicol 3-O phosphotransferase